jgi:phage terminase Nu1 subunit (DNA packaging protein)
VSNVVVLPTRGPRLLTKRQPAAHLGRSTRWLELRTREGMPVLEGTDRYGRRRYDLAAVEAWLANGKPRKREDRIGALERRVAALEAQLRRAG